MSDEVVPPPSQPGAVQDAVISTEAASKIAELFTEILTPLKGLRENVDKSYADSIFYMDRVVLLAGGTLTLTFTALAMISGHLKDAGRSAAHPGFVIAECWLLVLAITVGLLYSRLMIALRQKNDQTIVVAQMNLFARTKILEINPRADVSSLSLGKDELTSKGVKGMSVLAKISAATVHLSLLVAFICLACFIQDNIVLILTVAPPGIAGH